MREITLSYQFEVCRGWAVYLGNAKAAILTVMDKFDCAKLPAEEKEPFIQKRLSESNRMKSSAHQIMYGEEGPVFTDEEINSAAASILREWEELDSKSVDQGRVTENRTASRSYVDILAELNKALDTDRIPADDRIKINEALERLQNLLWPYSA